MRNIDRIVVHCTGTCSGLPIESIEAHFKRLGWQRGGYHFVIDWQGHVHTLVPMEEVANGAKGYNAHSIHVAYIGGVDDQGKPKDTRNRAQRQSLRAIVKALLRRWPEAEVVGHRDLSPDLDGDGRISPNEWTKMCPCFDVKTDGLTPAPSPRRRGE